MFAINPFSRWWHLMWDGRALNCAVYCRDVTLPYCHPFKSTTDTQCNFQRMYRRDPRVVSIPLMLELIPFRTGAPSCGTLSAVPALKIV
jgi:hypothetical protein